MYEKKQIIDLIIIQIIIKSLLKNFNYQHSMKIIQYNNLFGSCFYHETEQNIFPDSSIIISSTYTLA